MGARPEPREPEHFEHGWQHEVASRVEETFRVEDLFARMDDPSKALLRSQGGPGAGLALSTCPCQPTHDFHPPAVSCRSALSLAPSSSPYRAQLPVWPSTQLPWPPPSSLCKSGDLVRKRMGGRERCSENLARSRWQIDHQRDG